jgi:outer membrane protein OmpA-like peptidoglycan-associated protein
MLRIHLAAAAALICLAPAGALAEASRLQVILGGEAYDGPPKFEVTFDGEVLGEAAVEAAIDTATAGRFADAADKTPYVQSFEFEIPEALFKPGGEVRVRLTNEAFGGEGSNRDRNLYLAAISVNGQAVTVSGLSTSSKDGERPNELLGEFLVLLDGNEQAVSAAPAGGWPMPETHIATAPAVMAKARPVVMQLKAPARAEPEPIEEAILDPDPEGSACNRDELYNVVGFNENSNELTPRLEARLNQIVKDIGEQKCTVQVTGYSSTQGAFATNALFAIERAQNVLAYLRKHGLKFEEVSATGAGETEQFGPSFSANRRVVISVGP